MFRCDQCGKSVEPKISPIVIVAETRPMAYHNEFVSEDLEGKSHKHVVDSNGWEIQREEHICGACAVQYAIHVAARKPAAASTKFEEKVASTFKNPFIVTAVHTALERTAHGETTDIHRASQRARRDCAVAIPLIKSFMDANKGYVF